MNFFGVRCYIKTVEVSQDFLGSQLRTKITEVFAGKELWRSKVV